MNPALIPWPGKGPSGSQRASVPLASALLCALVLAWMPGLPHAGALRLWLMAAVVPCFALWEGLRPAEGRHLAPWAALAFVLALGAAFRDAPGASLQAAMMTVGMSAALLLGLRTDRRAPLDVASALAGALAAAPVWWGSQSLKGALCHLTPDLDGCLPTKAEPAAPWWGDGGTFGNPDWLAGFLVLTLIWTTGSLLRTLQGAPRRWRLGLLTASGIFQCSALVALESMGAAVALGAAGAATALVWGWQKGPRGKRVAMAGALALAVGALGALWSWPSLVEHLQGRAYLWRLSLDVIADGGLSGVGAGHFHGHFLQAQADWLASNPAQAHLWTNAHHAHNEALQAAAVHGALGLLLLWPLGRAARRTQVSAPWAATTAFWVMAMVSMPLSEPATAWLVAFGAGVVLRSVERRQRKADAPNTRPRGAGRVWRPLAIAVAAAVLIVGTGNLMGQRLLVRGVEARDTVLLERAQALMLHPARARHHLALALLEEDRPGEAMEAASAALDADPSTANWVLLGRAAVALGDHQAGIRAFRHAVRLHPQLFAGHFNLASTYEGMGDRRTACRHALRAHSLRPTDPRLPNIPSKKACQR